MQATTACNSSRNAKSFYYITKTNSVTIWMHQQVDFTTLFSTNNPFSQQYNRATQQDVGDSSTSTAKKITVNLAYPLSTAYKEKE
jgi:hypothetical protein